MESSSEDGEIHTVHSALHYDAAQYRVSYAQGRNTKEVDYDKHDEFYKKRYSTGRSGVNPGRVKRVVSCKRKTYHVTVVRRKQLGCGKPCDAANKENDLKCLQDKQQEPFTDPFESSLNVNNTTDRTGSEQTDYCILKELTKDHNAMTDVLFGRNLRLKVALTLWRRNVGELLTYFLKIQDSSVIVDFLPVICTCIDKNSPWITIGCCVDLFPLVKKVLSTPYEEYLNNGLKWIHSVLKRWWEELLASGYSGSSRPPLNESFQVFNQQLWELWHQDSILKSVPEAAAHMTKVIDSFLFQLN
ncbi:KATNB1-like protein 1 [Cololabis saira]|uniref:KATNB1-like protein 1 n=1 Tax=Cololabis saira TaxID=129043 RepID=UPI002AD54CDF|nr:KATNB1-like protein 1 [Cololabis saira]XP_061599001.1 KATNB1-like protein 1 [Cololabis saira]XP_061599002.1 KATNB1-like protein 1 [Cololabis saira]